MKKTTGNGRGGRLPLWLRGLVVVAAGWGVVLCGQHVVDAYEATSEYREAPLCTAGNERESVDGGEECVRREAGTALDRRTGEECTTDGSSAGGGGVTTCTTYYDLKVEWPERTAWLGVDEETYDEITKGDRAEVRLWRDDVVGLVTLGRTRSYPPPSESGALPWLAAGCLILALGAWAVVSGRLATLFAFPNFGLLFVAFGFGWLGSMALFGGHPVLWGFAILWTGFAVFWTVSARRMG
ncbi:hypothetical protein [Streptomyces sp. NBC_00102]|uniref:hypothetical protein n=1 Tax=Streptomyces sp. NBC_00102 TaxID=2975652 RepID=UPI002254546A|nr:hypothetical protein [Streptomyces sp. NBC_00102]MCX5396862.1 hypothetical protein [Streptomyces sp. NBC_00102]